MKHTKHRHGKSAVTITKRGVNRIESNADDREYEGFLSRMQTRFTSLLAQHGVLFTTDAREELWEVFLGAFNALDRQYHTCHTCEDFVTRFGHLVTIDVTGALIPVLWDVDDAPDAYKQSVRDMMVTIGAAAVTGVFLSDEPRYGRAEAGGWRHFSIVPPKASVFKSAVLEDTQAIASKREDFVTVERALDEWSANTLVSALALLNSDALYRSEKVLGQAIWLQDLQFQRDSTKNVRRRENILWRAIALAPDGFCHPRTSMIGTLLDDIEAGMDYAELSARFGKKMNPMSYQRPTAAPTAGAIAAAERLVAELGLERSLERRYARLDEVEAVWRKPVILQADTTSGVFQHLKDSKQLRKSENALRLPSQAITWEKFRNAVLPTAESIEVAVPPAGNFAALLTAVHADAPPLFQWDSVERRNPFSHYLYPEGSHASRWGLSAGWCTVNAIAREAPSWYGGEYAHITKSLFFLIPGAVDREHKGGGIFPENLRSELHGVRAVIEAYNTRATLAGVEEASAGGLIFQEGAQPVLLRVKPAAGVTVEYRIDRFD